MDASAGTTIRILMYKACDDADIDTYVISERNQITQPQPKNPSTVSLHHRRKERHTAASVALKVRHPSVYLASLSSTLFAVTDRGCFLELASVVFVCSAALPSPFVCRSRSRLRSAVVFVSVLRRSRSLGVHCSRSLPVHRSSSHSCSFGSHVALLQTLRPTRALHLAVELLSFVAAVSSLNPPPDNTLTQHQYSASNSATSDFYYNKSCSVPTSGIKAGTGWRANPLGWASLLGSWALFIGPLASALHLN
ncbi:hypothetical protein Ahy_B10g101431 [Arachis hypogaea]|uniref:Uncharacterized protein n=1 Tax=Arachis hypogaea TaxID=3818 RepID=A0A444WZT2_ARAHY|nr:hypothetical protein Ahy_B10g101431 [Arachis hypogaea]